VVNAIETFEIYQVKVHSLLYRETTILFEFDIVPCFLYYEQLVDSLLTFTEGENDSRKTSQSLQR